MTSIMHPRASIFRTLPALLAAAAGLAWASDAFGQVSPTAFTYQGEAREAGQPANGLYDFRFGVYRDETGGSPVRELICVDNVNVVNGRFTVVLDFGDLGQEDSYLELIARPDQGLDCSDDLGFATLLPRQPITAAPRAAIAGSAANANALQGLAASFFTNASNLSSGTLPVSRLSATVVRADAGNTFTGVNTFSGVTQFTNASNTFVGNGAGLSGLWRLGGNAGTNPATDFIGSTDDTPINFRSNNLRVGSLQSVEGVLPAPTLTAFRSANVLLGSATNSVGFGVRGATVIGGGADRYTEGSPVASTNRVTADLGIVAGGLGNQASSFAAAVVGGEAGLASGTYSAVVGGGSGRASGLGAATVGGLQALASGGFSFVGAGTSNQATGSRAAVGGGDSNIASGASSYVAGGWLNQATGEQGFAAGTRARALHNRTYVWSAGADGQDFSSTGANQYLINAPGGVGINTNNPGALLNVTGSGGVNIFTGDLQPFGIAGIETNFSAAAIAGRSMLFCAVDGVRRFSVTDEGTGTFAGDLRVADEVSAGQHVLLRPNGPVTGRGEAVLVQPFEPVGLSSEMLGAGSNSVLNLDNNFRLGGRGSDFAAGGALRIDPRPGVAMFQFWHRSVGVAPVETLAASIQANGNFAAAGSITGTAKFFEIDHPVDPANKTLRHACIESDEYKNVYDGIVVSDSTGYATIQLPQWMTALNESFRYQLTIIDESDSGDALMWARVARKIDDSNSFTIRTSGPNIEVSWMVTGVRKDAWAKANPFAPEADKAPTDAGKYLTPAAHGRPASEGVNSGTSFEARVPTAQVQERAARPVQGGAGGPN